VNVIALWHIISLNIVLGLRSAFEHLIFVIFNFDTLVKSRFLDGAIKIDGFMKSYKGLEACFKKEPFMNNNGWMQFCNSVEYKNLGLEHDHKRGSCVLLDIGKVSESVECLKCCMCHWRVSFIRIPFFLIRQGLPLPVCLKYVWYGPGLQ
jgi:hypothetical protein